MTLDQNHTPITPMFSQRLPFLRLSVDESDQLFKMCELDPDPVALSDGSFQYPLGRYALAMRKTGVDKQGQDTGDTYLIWAPHHDDMQITPFEVDERWSRILNRPIGHKLAGGYLTDLKNGNLGRIRILIHHDSRIPEKWMRKAIAAHQERAKQHRRDQNILRQWSKFRWGTHGVIYRLAKTGKNDDHGKPLYEVRVTKAPAIDLPLSQKDAAFKGLSGVFLNAGSVVHGGMSYQDAVAFIPKHFAGVGRLMHNGLDAYKTRARNYKKIQDNKLPRPRRWVASIRDVNHTLAEKPHHRLYVIVGYALGHLGWRDLGKTVSTVGATNIFLAAVLAWKEMFGWGAFALFNKIIGQSVAKTVEQLRGTLKREKSRQIKDEEKIAEVSLEYRTQDPNGGRFDPDYQPYLSIIPHAYLNTDIGRGGAVQSHLNQEQAVYRYLCNISNRLAGSSATTFRLGAFNGVRVSQAGVLDIEYVPEKNLVVARLDHDLIRAQQNLIPRKVIKAFQRMPADSPFLLMHTDLRSGKITAESISAESYERRMLIVSKVKYVSPIQLPFQLPDLPQPKSKIQKTHSGLVQTFMEVADNTVSEVIDRAKDLIQFFTPPRP